MRARATLLNVTLIGLCSGIAAGAGQSNSEERRHAEQQARSYFLQARQGDAEAAEKAVTLLEEAVAAAPNDISLWNLLGMGYMMKLSAVTRSGGDRDALASTLQMAAQAYDRVLERNPNDSIALSGHGMALTILGAMHRNQESLTKGTQELNRAVELDLTAVHPRLPRVFTTINLPDPMRNTPLVIADLAFVIQSVAGSNPRATDSLRLMLGDVYAETGQTEQARREYEAAASLSSTTREQAQSRLAALLAGSVPAAEISRLRSGLATNCAMCHEQ